MQRANVLITGFGPFPDVPHNASGELARRLARRARREFPHARFVCSVLPTEWHHGPARLQALYRAHTPRLALHFGVSSRVAGFEIERVAYNDCHHLPDAAGRLPGSHHVKPGAAAKARATLPVARVVKALTARGVPAAASSDAGRYLCNAVLFHALCEADAQAGCIAGFIHIPSRVGDDAGAVLSWETALAGGLAIIGACLPAAAANSAARR